MRAIPLTWEEAKTVAAMWHRHLSPPLRHRFSIGAVKDGRLVGVVIVGHAVSRGVPVRDVAEVTRLATDETRNACSFLYGAAARSAKGLGFHKIQTYNLDSEGGASLRAAGYVRVADVRGREWKRSDGSPRANESTDDKGRWERILNPPLPDFTFPFFAAASDVPQTQLEFA